MSSWWASVYNDYCAAAIVIGDRQMSLVRAHNDCVYGERDGANTRRVRPQTTTQAVRPRRPHPVSTGAMVVALAALPGALYSVFLTLVKFRSSYRCGFSLLSSCSSDCSAVLTSDWSMVLGAPISAYSTAYFLVLLGLAGALLWRPSAFMYTARPLLLLFGWAGLVSVAALAAYATLAVGGWCPYCAVIYALTLFAFLGVSLMHSQGHLEGVRSLLSLRMLQSSTLTITVLSFLALVSVETVWYRLAAADVAIDAECVVHREALPETLLRTSAPAKPRAQVALFVDLSCPHCRREYEIWREYVQHSGDRVLLSIYHMARHGECLPGSSGSKNPSAEEHKSCKAARAVECVEGMHEGKGLLMIDKLFALQDGSKPFFSRNNLGNAARELGIEGIPSDLESPEAATSEFFVCLEDDSSAGMSRIRDHADFGAASGFVAPPAALLILYDADGAPRSQMVKIAGAKDHGDPGRLIDEAEAELAAKEQQGLNTQAL